MQVKVAIVMGSDSDLPLVKKAADRLAGLEIGHELRILSAHRTPHEAARYAEEAESRGLGVIIAAAGMAAHLAGVLAAHTTLPVIGLPVAAGALNGVDALYAIVQMPKGVPVATVAINGAENAALLAAQILATADPQLRERLRNDKESQSRTVAEKDRRLQELGPEGYLNQAR